MTETYEQRQQRFKMELKGDGFLIQEQVDNFGRNGRTIERNLIQEPDYKTEAVRAASTIPCENLAQFMNNVEYILKWLKEKKRNDY